MKKLLFAILMFAAASFCTSAASKAEVSVNDTNVNAAIVEFIRTTTAALSDGVDFGKAQAPEVAREFLQFSKTKAIAQLVLVGLLTLAGIVVGILLIVCDDDDGELRFAGIVVLVVAVVFGGIFLCENGLELYKINTAPRVYLLENIKGIIH